MILEKPLNVTKWSEEIHVLDGKDDIFKLFLYPGFGYIKNFAFSLMKTNSNQILTRSPGSV